MFEAIQITDREFALFQKLVRELTGINLTPAKKTMVQNRLAKRLRHYAVRRYLDYYDIVTGNERECQVMVDLITTNETHFFREPDHFRFLGRDVLAVHEKNSPFRIWCAAASSGEEPYSLAMVAHDRLGDGPWEILASDISSRMLERAARAIYPMDRASEIPEYYLRRYCLKGVGARAGVFTMDRRIRCRITFEQINLNESLPALGDFDCVFLRNVLIYFSQETKNSMVERILRKIKQGGHLIMGHSESMYLPELKKIQPSVYRKP